MEDILFREGCIRLRLIGRNDEDINRNAQQQTTTKATT